MQPMLAVTAPVPGLLCISGRPAAEICADAPAFVPVAPFGPVVLEYRPFEPGWLPAARRIVFSGGRPMADSLTEDLFALCWPDGVTEIEFSPRALPIFSVETFLIGTTPCRIARCEKTFLELPSLACALPDGAQKPSLTRAGECALLMGSAGSKRYALALSGDLTAELGLLRAPEIEMESETVLRTLEPRGGVTGGTLIRRWQLGPHGLEALDAECILDRQVAPASAEEAILAALEAALDGDGARLNRLCTGNCADEISAIAREGSLCLPMKYALCSEPCVGLLTQARANFARVRRVLYAAERFGGEWKAVHAHLEQS